VELSRSEATLYRSDIDGLRAVSILVVVGYHAMPRLIPGGFVGVDIFFVISGFLITRIILSEIKRGHFRLLDFYARRVRRIFPALAVVLSVTYALGWLLLLPQDFALLGDNIVAGAAFVSNLFQLRHVGYFDPDMAANPLLHLWSLGIEEQFYIFWPLAALLLAGVRRQSTWMVGIAAVSFATSLLIYLGYAQWSFYAPIPRAWELMVGAIAARCFVEHGADRTVRSARVANLASVVGAALIGGAALLYDKTIAFPGLFALLPTSGALLILLAGPSWINTTILSSRVMVAVGLISYPLYLWHWPLLSYLATVQSGAPTRLAIALTVALSFVLAWLTYRFVERPIRRAPGMVPKLVASLGVLGIAGLVTSVAAGFEFRFPPEIRAVAQLARVNNAGFRDTCFLDGPADAFGPDCIEGGDRPLLFVWGDSTAAALYPGLKQVADARGLRLAHFAASQCPPIAANGANARCDRVTETVLGSIKTSHPDVVLLHAVWAHDIGLDRFRQTIRQLKALGVPRIVVVGPVPWWKRTLPLAIVNAYRFQRTNPERIAAGVEGAEADVLMQRLCEEEQVVYISAWQVLCNAEGCLTRLGPTADDVVETDTVHLSEKGSRFLVDSFADRLMADRK